MVKLHQVQLLQRVPIILKDLYDADLLEEDVIFAWAEKVTAPAQDSSHRRAELTVSIFLNLIYLFFWGYLQVSKKYVSKELAKEIHAKAAPFIKWLKEAEEESEGSDQDDGEEDENVEVMPSPCARSLARVGLNSCAATDDDDQSPNKIQWARLGAFASPNYVAL